MSDASQPLTLRERFIRTATWHGDLAEAEAMLAADPTLANADIHLAAITGDADAVARFLAADPASVHERTGPYGADALNLLGLSRYLRLHTERTPAFVRAATLLLDAGANPNTGFWTAPPHPEFETALYGAAGVAHNAEVTALLLERGADPNDGEVAYHAPETYDNRVLELLVQTGKLTQESLAVMLVRKCDWHDEDGLRYLLAHGADPNGARKRGWYALHHAIQRDNGFDMIAALLDAGADPLLAKHGRSALAVAAWCGRADVLTELAARGTDMTTLEGADALVAACALGDTPLALEMAAASSEALAELQAMEGTALARFACSGNVAGIRALLDVGLAVDARFTTGDAYWDIAPGSLALHVAAWRGHAAVVQLLLERGSPADLPDAKGRTPLMLAIKAATDSYWTSRRSPDAVRMLLAAGADASRAPFPCGYDEVDALLRSAGRA